METWHWTINKLTEYLQNRDTKWGILQAAARIFDPIGFLSPFTIWVKCLFQQMWARICTGSRSFSDTISTGGHEIHIFTEVHKKVYCAAAYILCLKSNGHCTTSLVASVTLMKCKVTFYVVLFVLFWKCYFYDRNVLICTKMVNYNLLVREKSYSMLPAGGSVASCFSSWILVYFLVLLSEAALNRSKRSSVSSFLLFYRLVVF